MFATGANTGLGFECAKHFLQMKPAMFILTVRWIERGKMPLFVYRCVGSEASQGVLIVYELAKDICAAAS